MSELKLYMSDDDIAVRYRQAANRKKAIKILADLNLCQEDDIINVLNRTGVLSEFPPQSKAAMLDTEYPIVENEQAPDKSKVTWTEQMVNQLIKLRRSGASAEQISEALGVNVMCIKNKIQRLKRKDKYVFEKNQSEDCCASDYNTASVAAVGVKKHCTDAANVPAEVPVPPAPPAPPARLPIADGADLQNALNCFLEVVESVLHEKPSIQSIYIDVKYGIKVEFICNQRSHALEMVIKDE